MCAKCRWCLACTLWKNKQTELVVYTITKWLIESKINFEIQIFKLHSQRFILHSISYLCLIFSFPSSIPDFIPEWSMKCLPLINLRNIQNFILRHSHFKISNSHSQASYSSNVGMGYECLRMKTIPLSISTCTRIKIYTSIILPSLPPSLPFLLLTFHNDS